MEILTAKIAKTISKRDDEMTMTQIQWDKDKLNRDIQKFDNVAPITGQMTQTFEAISRLVMLDRYSYKDTEKTTLGPGDLVVAIVKRDPTYPARGIGIVQSVQGEDVEIQVEEEYLGRLDPEEQATGIIHRSVHELEKPLEIYWEQISARVAQGLAQAEPEDTRDQRKQEYTELLSQRYFVPAGRVLYGAGTEHQVTYFNCYVMPLIPDSRDGISRVRSEIMEIMSRGGGVGLNGSTLRPKDALAKSVGGRSSGAVSWLQDISTLTHLVQQGGSRRGAQMIMLADWHPDIIEFIISKMQKPEILRAIIDHFEDPIIVAQAKNKLHFEPLKQQERQTYETIVKLKDHFNAEAVHEAETKLTENGTYSVNNPEFLSGANISVAVSHDFMEAVKNDAPWTLRFPDTESYDGLEMAEYNDHWHDTGDVRVWESQGHKVKDYHQLPARQLWRLINVCATYAAEPGIFFLDRANDMTNATAYGQRVIATNPCGEQPLAAYSVCNLAAINLSRVVNKETHEVDFDLLESITRAGVHMQNNVIDATPYFLPQNRAQALGERRVGMGVMGLADMLIYAHLRYGSPEANALVDKVFETIAVTAYDESIQMAKKDGSFPFLNGKTEAETRANRERFINSGYMQKMPEHIRQGVLDHGIRNSHLLTVAPTGSTGTLMGSIGTGLEPYFAFEYYRSGQLGQMMKVDSPIVQDFFDHHPGVTELPEYFVSAMELTPQEHVDVQGVIQRWVDSSISKTVNAPAGYPVDNVEAIYERAYDQGIKGTTVYVDGSRSTQVINFTSDDAADDAKTTSTDSGTATGTATSKNATGHAHAHADDEDREFTEAEEEFLRNVAEHGGEFESYTEDGVTYGVEPGETCPICRTGVVEELAGCNTCTNCGTQLKCGF